MRATPEQVRQRLDRLKAKAAGILNDIHESESDVAVLVIVGAFLDVQQETQDRIFAELAQLHAPGPQ
jgi:hypothetical protein